MVQSVRSVGDLSLVNLPVPLLENVDEEVEVLVLFKEMMLVKLSQFELSVHLRPEQQLNIVLNPTFVIEVDYVLQRCRHLRLEYYLFHPHFDTHPSALLF